MTSVTPPTTVLYPGRVGTWRQTKGPELGCYIYARSATVEADTAIRLDRQVTACKALIDAMAPDGWVHRRTITEQGSSGSNLYRPGLLEALAAIKSGCADVLVVPDPARLSRRIADLDQIRAYVAENGGRIVSPFQNNWTTAGARFMQHPQQLVDHCQEAQDYVHVNCAELSRFVSEWEDLVKKVGVSPTRKGGPRHG